MILFRLPDSVLQFILDLDESINALEAMPDLPDDVLGRGVWREVESLPDLRHPGGAVLQGRIRA